MRRAGTMNITHHFQNNKIGRHRREIICITTNAPRQTRVNNNVNRLRPLRVTLPHPRTIRVRRLHVRVMRVRTNTIRLRRLRHVNTTIFRTNKANSNILHLRRHVLRVRQCTNRDVSRISFRTVRLIDLTVDNERSLRTKLTNNSNIPRVLRTTSTTTVNVLNVRNELTRVPQTVNKRFPERKTNALRITAHPNKSIRNIGARRVTTFPISRQHRVIRPLTPVNVRRMFFLRRLRRVTNIIDIRVGLFNLFVMGGHRVIPSFPRCGY